MIEIESTLGQWHCEYMDLADSGKRAKTAVDGGGWRFAMTRIKQESEASNDRRARQRYPVNAPLNVILGERRIPAFTRDLSNRGAYFYLAPDDSALIAPEIEFVIELPPEITLSTCCLIQCRGRKVRAENTASGLAGIAVEILDYSILRQPAAGA